MIDHSKASDCRKIGDSEGVPSMKLYIALLLLPQLVWVLTCGGGWFALCESCGQEADLKTLIQRFAERSSDCSGAMSARCQEETHDSSEDAITSQTSLQFLSQLFPPGTADSPSSSTVLPNEECCRGSTTEQSPGADGPPVLSSSCACGSELPPEELNNESDSTGGWSVDLLMTSLL